jgi:GTP-binding protein LepA
MNLLGCKKEDIIPVSAKTGKNVEAILDAVMDRVPQPIVYNGDLNPENQELKALVFDSQYDPYRGVVSYVKVFS